MAVSANDYDRYVFCPVVASSYELAEQLAHADEYDYTRMHEFKEEMLGGCDGRSNARIVEYLIENA